MRKLIIPTVLLLSALAKPAQAQVSSINFAENIAVQISDLNACVSDTEKQDLPQLLALRVAAQTTLDSIQTNGLAHIETIQAMQSLVISYRFSKDLWNHIRTAGNSRYIDQAQGLANEIAQATGLDQSVFSKITALVFYQVASQVRQIPKETKISDTLQTELKNLMAPLGRLIGIAQLGDNLKTLREGEAMFKTIEALDQDLDKVSVSDAAYETISTIRGLNEYYGKVIRAQSGGQL
jgi:hypothetical protein